MWGIGGRTRLGVAEGHACGGDDVWSGRHHDVLRGDETLDAALLHRISELAKVGHAFGLEAPHVLYR